MRGLSLSAAYPYAQAVKHSCVETRHGSNPPADAQPLSPYLCGPQRLSHHLTVRPYHRQPWRIAGVSDPFPQHPIGAPASGCEDDLHPSPGEIPGRSTGHSAIEHDGNALPRTARVGLKSGHQARLVVGILQAHVLQSPDQIVTVHQNRHRVSKGRCAPRQLPNIGIRDPTSGPVT